MPRSLRSALAWALAAGIALSANACFRSPFEPEIDPETAFRNAAAARSFAGQAALMAADDRVVSVVQRNAAAANTCTEVLSRLIDDVRRAVPATRAPDTDQTGALLDQAADAESCFRELESQRWWTHASLLESSTSALQVVENTRELIAQIENEQADEADIAYDSTILQYQHWRETVAEVARISDATPVQLWVPIGTLN